MHTGKEMLTASNYESKDTKLQESGQPNQKTSFLIEDILFRSKQDFEISEVQQRVGENQPTPTQKFLQEHLLLTGTNNNNNNSEKKSFQSYLKSNSANNRTNDERNSYKFEPNKHHLKLHQSVPAGYASANLQPPPNNGQYYQPNSQTLNSPTSVSIGPSFQPNDSGYIQVKILIQFYHKT